MLTKMVFHHDPLVERTETEMHAMLRDEYVEDEDEDKEETLSFCEFSINSSDSDLWESSNSSRESSQNSSFKSSEEEEDDGFEFFSHELSIGNDQNSCNPQPKNVMFCGKLISYKEPTSENTQNVDCGIKLTKHMKTRTGIFRWKWNYFSSSHKTKPQNKCSEYSSQVVLGSYESLKTEPDQPSSKQRCNASKKHNKEIHKLPFFTSSPGTLSSKWSLFFFGVTKYKTKMELRDIKMRQSHSRRSSSFHDDKSTLCMHKSNGFWAVLGALSCGTTSDQSTNNVVVKPSTAAASGIPLLERE